MATALASPATPEGAHPLRSRWVWPAIVLFGLTYAPLLAGRAPAGGDLVNQYLPYQQMIRDAVRSGQWPLWNPWTFCGRPLMGDIQVGVCYPPNWLHWALPLPLPATFALVLALHGAWMIAGCLALGRRLGLSAPAALLGTVLWAANPFFLLRFSAGIVLFQYVAAWWPWMALAALRLVERPGWSRMAALAGALLMALLAGSPQIAYYGWLAAVAWALLLPSSEGDDAPRSLARRVSTRAGWLAGSVAAAAGLSALQTLQTADFIGSSFARGGGTSWAYIVDGSLAPRLFWLMLNPGLLGTGHDPGHYWGSRMDFSEACPYLPLWVPAILVPLALGWLLSRRVELARDRLHRRLGWLALAAMALGLSLAPGEYSPLFAAFYGWVPGFDAFRVPARLTVFYHAGAALLAALVFDQIVRGRVATRALTRTAAAGAACAAAMVALVDGARVPLWRALGSPYVAADLVVPPEHYRIVDAHARAMALRVAVFTILGAAAVASARRRRSDAAGGVAWAAPALAAAELLWLAAPFFDERAFRPLRDYVETVYPRTPLVERLLEIHRGGRVLWLDDTIDWRLDQNTPEIFPNRLAMHRLPDARGYDPVNARWLGEWMNLLDGDVPARNPQGMMFVSSIERPAWLTLMGVETVVSYRDLSTVPGLRPAARMSFPEGDLVLWQNERFRGLAYAAPRPAVAPPQPAPPWRASLFASARLAENPSIEPTAALVAEPAAAPLLPATRAVDERFQVRALEEGPNRFRYEIDFPEPALLVLAQSAYSGWTASIDGRPAEPLVLSGIWPATPAPAGRHRIEFDYRPPAFSLGAWISAATLIVLLYGLVRSALVRRRDAMRPTAG